MPLQSLSFVISTLSTVYSTYIWNVLFEFSFLLKIFGFAEWNSKSSIAGQFCNVSKHPLTTKEPPPVERVAANDCNIKSKVSLRRIWIRHQSGQIAIMCSMKKKNSVVQIPHKCLKVHKIHFDALVNQSESAGCDHIFLLPQWDGLPSAKQLDIDVKPNSILLHATLKTFQANSYNTKCFKCSGKDTSKPKVLLFLSV